MDSEDKVTVAIVAFSMTVLIFASIVTGIELHELRIENARLTQQVERLEAALDGYR